MKFVIAQMQHETNTFSPLATPLAAFRPLWGEEARAGDLHADGMAGLEPAIRAKAPDPTVDFFGKMAVAELRVLAERLVPDQRDAVVLTVFEGLTAAEAADRLEVSVETIHVRKSRGLSNLRRLINEKGNGPEGRDGTP